MAPSGSLQSLLSDYLHQRMLPTPQLHASGMWASSRESRLEPYGDEFPRLGFHLVTSQSRVHEGVCIMVVNSSAARPKILVLVGARGPRRRIMDWVDILPSEPVCCEEDPPTPTHAVLCNTL